MDLSKYIEIAEKCRSLSGELDSGPLHEARDKLLGALYGLSEEPLVTHGLDTTRVFITKILIHRLQVIISAQSGVFKVLSCINIRNRGRATINSYGSGSGSGFASIKTLFTVTAAIAVS